MTRLLRSALSPSAEISRADTSLRYTDILFGFVIKELFVRLQNWGILQPATKWHLIAGTVLVLGSWIGYRRSLNRSAYEVKFFNLPLWRFVTDQLMLILYFHVAVMTASDGTNPPSPTELATQTVEFVALIFILYVIWDLLGIWMAVARSAPPNGHLPRYAKVDKDGNAVGAQDPDWAGLAISGVALIVLVVLRARAAQLTPVALLVSTTLALLGYRWVKEVRTSWRLMPRPVH